MASAAQFQCWGIFREFISLGGCKYLLLYFDVFWGEGLEGTCTCPPASPKTKLVVSDLCISLPRETNFAEAHKLPGHMYSLDSF